MYICPSHAIENCSINLDGGIVHCTSTITWMGLLCTRAQWIKVSLSHKCYLKHKMFFYVSWPYLFFVFFIQSIICFSCAPAWDDNTNVSYTIYIFLVGFFTPNSIIICTSAGVLRIHKKVNCYRFKNEWYNWKVYQITLI